jgi:hypothetical protein
MLSFSCWKRVACYAGKKGVTKLGLDKRDEMCYTLLVGLDNLNWQRKPKERHKMSEENPTPAEIAAKAAREKQAADTKAKAAAENAKRTG